MTASAGLASRHYVVPLSGGLQNHHSHHDASKRRMDTLLKSFREGMMDGLSRQRKGLQPLRSYHTAEGGDLVHGVRICDWPGSNHKSLTGQYSELCGWNELSTFLPSNPSGDGKPEVAFEAPIKAAYQIMNEKGTTGRFINQIDEFRDAVYESLSLFTATNSDWEML